MAPPKRSTPKSAASIDAQVEAALAWLKRHSSKTVKDGMARYAIPSDKALGVAMKDIKALGKELGRNHELALALWKTDCYEARMLTSFVGDPAQLTAAEMDRWCKDFDNWAFPDALAFNLFDRSPHAWDKVTKWSGKRDEFQKRAAFALLWALALHDKQSGDAPFLQSLKLIEAAATDERNFVKKAVLMALKAVGLRNPKLKAAAIATSRRLAASADPTARWIAKDALRELT